MWYKAEKIVALFLVCIIQTQGFEIRTDLLECCCHLLPPENRFGETANTTTALVAYSDFRQQKKTVTAGKKANDYAFVLPDSHGQPIFSSYLDFHRHSRPTTLRSYSNYQKSYHRVNINMKPAEGLFVVHLFYHGFFSKSMLCATTLPSQNRN